MASLLLVANSFSQKKVVYSNVAVMKITNEEKSTYADNVNIEWNGAVNNIDNVKRVAFDTYAFTITQPFEILSEKIADDGLRVTYSSEAVDDMNNPYSVGLVRSSGDQFLFVFYDPENTSNAVCFMVTLKSGSKKSIDPKKF
jgi:hypothetical protein